MKREYLTEKSCAPYCTVSCVHQSGMMDFWRREQTVKSKVSEATVHRDPLVPIQTRQ